MNNRRKTLNKIENVLEMPKEIYSEQPKITITGFEELLIENYKGIVEYEDYYVRINTYIGIININGFNIRLEKMTEDDLKVTGKLESVDIERKVE